jgi:hypothetical protein
MLQRGTNLYEQKLLTNVDACHTERLHVQRVHYPVHMSRRLASVINKNTSRPQCHELFILFKKINFNIITPS